jgi:hypothetical protein
MLMLLKSVKKMKKKVNANLSLIEQDEEEFILGQQ